MWMKLDYEMMCTVLSTVEQIAIIKIVFAQTATVPLSHHLVTNTQLQWVCKEKVAHEISTPPPVQSVGTLLDCSTFGNPSHWRQSWLCSPLSTHQIDVFWLFSASLKYGYFRRTLECSFVFENHSTLTWDYNHMCLVYARFPRPCYKPVLL